jgi:hypoxanthine phosphoribosyltransferase
MYLPENVIVKGSVFKPFISREEIEGRVAELGRKISEDYADKKPILIGVLNGAFIFLADLMRYISVPCEVDFMKLSSYGDEKVSRGQVKELKHLDANIHERHVIVVEDIIDTGLSMNYILHLLSPYQPASVRVATLLHKPDATKYPVKIDYVGFKIPTKFVLGYGLDYAQEGRNLGQIYVIEEHVNSEQEV